MYTLLVLLTVIIAIILIIAVLLQAGKGAGLAGGTFGGSGNFGTMFGTRRTADFLSIATWWLAGIMVALTLLTNIFFLPGGQREERRSVIDSGRQQQTAPQQIPQAPQQQPQQ